MLFFHLLPGISETVQNRNIKVDKITQQNKIVSVEKYVLGDSKKKKKSYFSCSCGFFHPSSTQFSFPQKVWPIVFLIFLFLYGILLFLKLFHLSTHRQKKLLDDLTGWESRKTQSFLNFMKSRV